MPLRTVGFQERASQTTDQCNEVAEAKKIIADLQGENEELGTPRAFSIYQEIPEIRVGVYMGHTFLVRSTGKFPE